MFPLYQCQPRVEVTRRQDYMGRFNPRRWALTTSRLLSFFMVLGQVHAPETPLIPIPDGQKFMETIVDHGGTDTIDASAQSTSSIINLTPGSYSSIGLRTVSQYAAEVATMVVDAAISAGYATESGRAADEAFWTSYYTSSFNSQDDGTNTIYNTSNNDLYYLGQKNPGIAYSATIENAIGGAGADTITGNTAANIIKGGAVMTRSMAEPASIPRYFQGSMLITRLLILAGVTL